MGALRVRHLIFLLLVGMGLLVAAASAADKVLDASQINAEPVSLTDYFAVLEDPSATLTLAEVKQADMASRFKGGLAPAAALSYGYTRSAYWLRVNLQNASDRPLERMLEIGYARLSSVQFHQPGADESGAAAYRSLTTGNALPFATQSYPNRFFVFPLTLPAHSAQVVYLRLQSTGPLLVPARLWEAQAFHAYERNDYLGQAWYFGMATAMVLFNLLLFIALRDSIYLLYVSFVTCTALTLATQNGLTKEFLWPEATLWSDIATFVGYSISIASLLHFMRHMLNTWTVIPKFDQLLKFLVGLLLLAPIGFAISLQTFAKYTSLFFPATMLLILGTGLFCAFKRQRSAYFFVAAFAMLVFGAVMNGMRSLGLLPSNLLTVNALQFGSASEMLLLAFALADRFNEVRREKARAQREAIQAQAETLRVQAEKMTSLTQLVTNVAHEINTPIGAVKSSGNNIAVALDEALANLPRMFEILDPQPRGLFTQLVSQAKEPAAALTTREERAIRREVKQQLEAAGVDNADEKARILVQLRAQSAALDYLPLLRHPECDFILSTALSIGSIINNASNINTAVDRVAKIVTTLKTFSQADSIGEMTDADLKDGIESVLMIYSNQIKQGTKLVRQYEVLPPLSCLPDELTQVWTHLIHNALQAMSNKGRLTIGLRLEGSNAVVSIGDTGSGISDDIRGRIFEPFFTTRPPGEGSGLGLDIVKKIVEKHKGRIIVQTEVGVGSTFSVYLPMSAAA